MNFRDAASLMRFRDAAAPPIAHPFPSPPMEPTAFACDGCGLGTVSLRVHQRPNGDEHWLCVHCSTRAFGAVAVDVAAEVVRDRAAYAGGMRRPRPKQPKTVLAGTADAQRDVPSD